MTALKKTATHIRLMSFNISTLFPISTEFIARQIPAVTPRITKVFRFEKKVVLFWLTLLQSCFNHLPHNTQYPIIRMAVDIIAIR